MSDAHCEMLRLDHGRRVGLYRLSDGTIPIVFCHAAPGSGDFDPDPIQTIAHDVALLAIDRPGYGRSDPPLANEWITPGRAADDVAGVLASLGLARVDVVGWSAGGRVALALAARYPQLVARVAILATPAPDEEVRWIPEEQKTMVMALAGQGPSEVHSRLGDVFRPMEPADPYASAAFAALGNSPADASILEDADARGRLGKMVQGAWRQGPAGMAADIAGYVLKPWGFDPGQIEQEVLLLYGTGDPIAGPAHGEWWKSSLPNAKLELISPAGHLLVIPQWGRVLDFLTAKRG